MNPSVFSVLGPERLAVIMHRLIVRIWDQEELPDEWKLGVIHPVYKKGDRLDCANFRAITVLNAAYKILSYSSADNTLLQTFASCYRFRRQLSSWICWRQINYRPNLYSTADPPEMPRAPDPYAPPVHRLYFYDTSATHNFPSHFLTH